MNVKYTPLTQVEIDIIGTLKGFSPPAWTGPALPRPEGNEGIAELIDTFKKLIARAQYLIEVKDGLSVEYTLQGITATAERFMLGTEEQVQQAGNIHSVLVLIESFLERYVALVGSSVTATAFAALHEKVGELLAIRPAIAKTSVGLTAVATSTPPDSSADYSAFALEDPSQFAMAWTTYEDTFRIGYPLVGKYAAAVTDPEEATSQFWPTLCKSALPYNLLVLQNLSTASAATFRTNFGTAWSHEFDELLHQGRLYGIDMTIFSNLDPYVLTNGTVRFTPSTMALLSMDDHKKLTPIAVYVTDPQNINCAQVYTQASVSWIYSLMAVKTSLTVYGIWLGHVYTLHIVTAAMQMVTLNYLPKGNIIYQLLAPQSNYTIPFDLILLLAWSRLSPPTSISDSGKFLTLCSKFAATHDFFSTDPHTALIQLNLDVENFTDPSISDQPWNLYPNVQTILHLWDITEAYVKAAVEETYHSDESVSNDSDLANWIAKASDQSNGNIMGLPRMDSVHSLIAVVTSILYRIIFHGMGRLKSIGSPEPSFAPNYPPCLQSAVIPDPNTPLSTAELLKTYLPRTGTLGELVSFYDLFSHSAPYIPLIPNKGKEDELFFDEHHPLANKALITFRGEIEKIIRQVQPDWVQIGQWPRNIEL